MVPSRLANVVAYFHNSASCSRLQPNCTALSFMDHVVYVGYLDCFPWPVQHAELCMLIWQYSNSKHRLSHALPNPSMIVNVRRGSIFGELHNPYAMNSSSNNIQAQALSMLHINVLLPPCCCMKNRRGHLDYSVRQHILLQP